MLFLSSLHSHRKLPALGDLVSRSSCMSLLFVSPRSSLSTTLSVHLVSPPFAIFSQIVVSASLLSPQVRINATRSRAHCSPPPPHTVHCHEPACSRLFHVVYFMYAVRPWFVGPVVNPWIGLVRQSRKTRNSPRSTLVRPRCSPRTLPRQLTCAFWIDEQGEVRM